MVHVIAYFVLSFTMHRSIYVYSAAHTLDISVKVVQPY
jgi:hypothetical protein